MFSSGLSVFPFAVPQGTAPAGKDYKDNTSRGGCFNVSLAPRPSREEQCCSLGGLTGWASILTLLVHRVPVLGLRYGFFATLFPTHIYESACLSSSYGNTVTWTARFPKHIVVYFTKKGFTAYREWFEDELQRRREASDLSKLAYTSTGVPKRRQSATFAAVASRLRSKIVGSSPQVLQESIEQSLRRRRNFIFHINSPTDYKIELPKNFNFGTPLSEPDTQFVFRIFQKAISEKLGETLLDEDYPQFAETLGLYLEQQRIAEAAVTAKDDLQESTKTVDSSALSESPEERLISFTEYQSAIGSDQTVFFDVQSEVLVEKEERKQIQEALDSCIAAVHKFRGLHRDWPTFKSEFNTLVIKNPTYSSTERMCLLIEALSEGEAKENISDLTVTDGNWVIAWGRMEGSYDFPRETVHAAIRPLLELPPLMSQKARFDTKTIKEFNQTLTTNDVPSLPTCINCLEMQAKNDGLTKEIKSNSAAAAPSRNKTGRDHKEAKALLVTTDSEAGYSTDDSRKHVRFRKTVTRSRNRSRSKSPSILKKSVHVATKSKRIQARTRSSSADSGRVKAKPTFPFKPRPWSYCGNQDNRISKCGTFGSMSERQWREWVKYNKRCYNCLGTHQVSDCTVERTCFVCRKRHHTLLHAEGVESKTTRNVNIVMHQCGSNEHTGLLPTASVIIPNKVTPHEAICLLDTGAQKNFVTNELVKKLRLPRTKVKEGFVAAGGQSLTTLGVTVVARIMRDRKARMGHRGSPNAYYTDLGWIVIGSVVATGPRSVMAIYGSNPPLEHTMEKFWTIEELPTSNPHLTREEQNFLDHYEENTIRLPNGQHQVRLPFVENQRPLGDSKQMAMRRWIAVEQRTINKKSGEEIWGNPGGYYRSSNKQTD
ncbi:unnamed protein product [Allacma fusca]|uniref:Peptidase A2 domain-containing protein n=1 Tax=Allacma fusca TaxID=39272 RepID=A0A8J2PD12_9HEXA|nr:unnamed protein product [Allacma fusca]